MLVHCNVDLNAEEAWRAKNGATRRTLKVINKAGVEGKRFQAQLGTLNKGNHSFIFINKPNVGDNRIMGLFVNSAQGYEVVEEHSPENAAVFENSSYGGPGNSCSQFGIYQIGTVLAEFTYKGRQGKNYWVLNKNGWEYLGKDVPLDNDEIKEV